MEKQVAIIGAGLSGLLACKHMIEKGFDPIVFEAQDEIGGVWGKTMKSTKLQNPKFSFQFSDFPWPSSVEDIHPCHTQIIEYFKSYAQHFNLYHYIRYNCKVLSLDYIGVAEEETQSWDLWGGTGRPFSPRGKWHLRVENSKVSVVEEYQFEFVIMCIGRYSGLPSYPDFLQDKGSDLFSGQILHSVDYSGMNSTNVDELIKGKRIVIVGSMKSALDIAAECANINGIGNPCTIIQRTINWMIPNNYASTTNLGFLLLNPLSEMMVHKPGETFLQSIWATLLSPVRWAISKFVEMYLMWKLPLKKYEMIPKHSFFQQFSSCQLPVLPENFFDMVAKGSIKLKKSQSISLSKRGLVLDDEVEPLQADFIILATGFNGADKLKNIFTSPTFQSYIEGNNNKIVPLYRQTILPRIPQLAVIGYMENISNLEAYESLSKWLAHFLSGSFKLPSIREMEKDVSEWESYMKRYAGKYYWRACVGVPMWFKNQLCRDLPLENKNKKAAKYQQIDSVYTT